MRSIWAAGIAVVPAIIGLVACGGGGGAGTTPHPGPISGPTGTPSPSPVPSAAASADDWVTYAHDLRRTGYEQQPTGITASTVGSLQLAWRVGLDPACATTAANDGLFAVEASPLVTGGMVYVADICGMVTALSAQTGATLWSIQLPLVSGDAVSGVYGTPTLADGLLFVPVWGNGASASCDPNSPQTCTTPALGGYLAAINAQTGAIVWTTTPLARGLMRGEPIVVGGTVFEGLAGGDPSSGATEGGLLAFSVSTGAQTGSFTVAPASSMYAPYDGGSSWSPISYDGTNLYFGTGNTRDDPSLQDALVELSPTTLQPTSYVLQTYDGNDDEDVGGGALLWGGNLYFTGKSGYYYGLATNATSVPLFKTLINTSSPPGGNGGISTPTTDGTVIAASSGYDLNGYQSNLDVFPVGSGTQICQLRATNSALYGPVAFVSGIGFTPLDNDVPSGTAVGATNGPAPAFVAFNDSCNVVWQANAADVLQFFYAGAAVVPSGVYAVDGSDEVYSWKLPAMITAAQRRVVAEQRAHPPVRRLFTYRHYAHPHRL